jgi:hypothetical protein
LVGFCKQGHGLVNEIIRRAKATNTKVHEATYEIRAGERSILNFVPSRRKMEAIALVVVHTGLNISALPSLCDAARICKLARAQLGSVVSRKRIGC